ncbi:MAG: hypothetical protein JWP19_392 [Rhodoglobus sp.]|nr:hypothetical protein [Rhodoglobus sp.]
MPQPQPLGELAHRLECLTRPPAEGCYRHEPEQFEPLCGCNAIGEGIELGRCDSPTLGIVCEIELDEYLPGLRAGEGVDERLPVDGVQHLRVLAHLLRLLRLELSDEMPGRIEIGKLRDLRLRLLVAALAEIPHPEFVELAYEHCRVELGDDDGSDGLGVTPGFPRGIHYPPANGFEPFGKAGLMRGHDYLRKSGMSRSLSSSSNDLSAGACTRLGSAFQAESGSAATGAVPAGVASGIT